MNKNYELYDKVSALLFFNLKEKEIAAEAKCSISTVQRIKTVMKIIEKRDWQRAIEFYKQQGKYVEKMFEWAGTRYNVVIPDIYGEEQKEKQEDKQEEKARCQNKNAEDINVLQSKLDVLIKNQEKLYFIMTQENQKLAIIIELLQQFMDVVIPKYVNDILKSNQTDTNIIVQALK